MNEFKNKSLLFMSVQHANINLKQVSTHQWTGYKSCFRYFQRNKNLFRTYLAPENLAKEMIIRLKLKFSN